MKDKIINDFNPDDGLLRIPIQAIKDIQEKGFAFMTLPSGRVINITKDDLLFKRDEIEKFESDCRADDCAKF